MWSPRWWVVTLCLVACGASGSDSASPAAPQALDVTDVALNDTEEDDAVVADGVEVLTDDATAPETLDVSGYVSHFQAERLEDGETTVLFDATYEGFEVNTFGAELYGSLLKLWGGDGYAEVGIFIRVDAMAFPGSVTPDVPGNGAWVVLMLGDDAVFSTQMPSGTLTIETCPSALGQMITGHFEEVAIFDLADMSGAYLSGTFDVVLGSLSGDAGCGDTP